MASGLWSIFGGIGGGAAPEPEPEPVPPPVEVRPTDEERMKAALGRDARRKCSGMSMVNHVTAWNALGKLEGEHKEWMLQHGYSAQCDSMLENGAGPSRAPHEAVAEPVHHREARDWG